MNGCVRTIKKWWCDDSLTWWERMRAKKVGICENENSLQPHKPLWTAMKIMNECIKTIWCDDVLTSQERS